MGRIAGWSMLVWVGAAVLPSGHDVAAAEPAPRVIVAPDWVEAGDPGKFGDLFPAKASAAGLSTGRVTLDCVADQGGRMTDCHVTSETPGALGFGEAALKLATTMAIAPRGSDDQPVEGAHVRFAVRINKPDGTPTEGPPSVPRIINDPIWRRTPNDAERHAAFPEAATYQEVNGRVDLRCLVQGDGHLTDCTVLLETPPEFGFGQAALKVAPKYQIAPQAADGAPTAGGLVRFTLEFHPGLSFRGRSMVVRPVWAAAPSRQDVDAARAAAASPDLPQRMVFTCRFAADGGLIRCHSIGPGKAGATEDAASSLLAQFRLKVDAYKDLSLPEAAVQVAIQWSAAPEVEPASVSSPFWVRGPTASSVHAAFPSKAAALGVGHGQAGLACVADRLGRMTQCQVIGEAPGGAGFGEAALSLSRDLAVNLWTEEGRPIEGRHVSFSIPFDRAAGEQASPSGPAR